jgi:two-component system, LuxR family, sensor kinase FixL
MKQQTNNNLAIETNGRLSPAVSMAQLQQLLAEAPIGLLQVDHQGVLVYVNPQAGRLFQQATTALLSSGWEGAIHVDDQTAVSTSWRELHSQSQPGIIEFRLASHHEPPRWLQIQWQPVSDPHGYVGVVSEITQQKATESTLAQVHAQLEQSVRLRTEMLTKASKTLEEQIFARRRTYLELERSEERWRSLVESAPDMILLLDRHGKIDYINHTRPRPSLGAGFVTGHTVYEFADPPYHEEIRVGLAAVFEQATAVTHNVTGRDDDGNLRWFQSHLAPIQFSGKVIGATAIVRDVTEERESQLQLQQTQDHLAHVGRVGMVGEMTAQFAHEVGQPLFAISSYIEGCLIRLERDGGMDPALMKVLRETVTQSHRAIEIVRRLRDFLRKQELQRVSMDINKVAIDAMQLAKIGLAKYGTKYRLELTPMLPPAELDRIQVMQILVNLILNAAESMAGNPHSEQVVTLATRAEVDNSIVIEVRDTGPGFPGANPEALFEPFFTTKPNGLGLGLSICRSIAQAHGGKITARPADIGPGAVFTVELPCEPRD